VRITYYVDENENVYLFQGYTEQGLFKLYNLLSEEEYHADPKEVKNVDSDSLIVALKQQLKDISYALHTEISTRNHEEMTDEEKAHHKGLLLASHIVHTRKLKI
jgi:hypothetical protein